MKLYMAFVTTVLVAAQDMADESVDFCKVCSPNPFGNADCLDKYTYGSPPNWCEHRDTYNLDQPEWCAKCKNAPGYNTPECKSAFTQWWRTAPEGCGAKGFQLTTPAPTSGAGLRLRMMTLRTNTTTAIGFNITGTSTSVNATSFN